MMRTLKENSFFIAKGNGINGIRKWYQLFVGGQQLPSRLGRGMLKVFLPHGS
jgi:hypothetical protein